MMRANTFFCILLVLLTGLTGSVAAQEFNYLMNEVGPQSSMLSGAVTAGVKDNSAIYYNPAGLAYVKNSSLSFSSNGYSAGILSVVNGAGTDLDLKSYMFSTFSQIFSFVQKIPKLPVSLTFALINTHHSNIRTELKNNLDYDVISTIEGEEHFVGTYQYYNKIREDWGGFGWGKRIKPNFGIGFSTFITYHSQDYYKSQTAEVYPKTQEPTYDLLANSAFSEQLNYSVFGWLFIVGASWQYQNIKFGLSVTTPRINLGFVSLSNIKKTVDIHNLVSDTLNNLATYWGDDLHSVYKSPLIIDLGLEYPWSDKTILYSKISFYSKIRKYKILKESNYYEELPDFVDKYFEGFTNMVMASRFIINISAAMQHHFSEKFALGLGFRTDINPIDRNEIDVYSDSYPGETYWNIYHITSGVIWISKKYELTLGLDYAMGFDRNTRQYVNLSEPSDVYFLFGKRDNSANVRYNQVNISLGFTYFFTEK